MDPFTIVDLFAGMNLLGLLGAVAVGARYVGRAESAIQRLEQLPSKVERNAQEIAHIRGLLESGE